MQKNLYGWCQTGKLAQDKKDERGKLRGSNHMRQAVIQKATGIDRLTNETRAQ